MLTLLKFQGSILPILFCLIAWLNLSDGAKTFSITTLSTMTLSIMTLSTMTFSITKKIETLSVETVGIMAI
jgi:hypothetical protein